MKTFYRIYNTIIFIFLYAPIAVLIAYSFNESKNRGVFSGFTFKWYADLFQDEAIINALVLSLVIAVISALVSTVIGTATAVGLQHANKKLKTVMLTLNNVPMVNPEIVTGISFMLLCVAIMKMTGGMLAPGLYSVIIAHISFCIPYVVLSVMPKLRQMNPHIQEAAQDLGCTPFKSFFKVVLPEIMPGVMTGLMMSFTLSLDDFVISYFAGGSSTETLPILIFSQARKGVSPKIYALTSILFVTILIMLLLINYIQSSQNAKNERMQRKAGKKA